MAMSKSLNNIYLADMDILQKESYGCIQILIIEWKILEKLREIWSFHYLDVLAAQEARNEEHYQEVVWRCQTNAIC